MKAKSSEPAPQSRDGACSGDRVEQWLVALSGVWVEPDADGVCQDAVGGVVDAAEVGVCHGPDRRGCRKLEQHRKVGDRRSREVGAEVMLDKVEVHESVGRVVGTFDVDCREELEAVHVELGADAVDVACDARGCVVEPGPTLRPDLDRLGAGAHVAVDLRFFALGGRDRSFVQRAMPHVVHGDAGTQEVPGAAGVAAEQLPRVDDSDIRRSNFHVPLKLSLG